MLAPRKTLWSTPDAVLQTVTSWIELKSNDVVCDIGCGDGRVLIEWALKQTLAVKFIGIEICHERAREAQNNVREAFKSGLISSLVQVNIYCANAVEAIHLYQDTTVFFLYLTPRGLRLVHPILKRIAGERALVNNETLKVITYMAPLPQETYVATEHCHVDHHPGAAWPLYLYHLHPDVEKQAGVIERGSNS